MLLRKKVTPPLLFIQVSQSFPVPKCDSRSVPNDPIRRSSQLSELRKPYVRLAGVRLGSSINSGLIRTSAGIDRQRHGLHDHQNSWSESEYPAPKLWSVRIAHPCCFQKLLSVGTYQQCLEMVVFDHRLNHTLQPTATIARCIIQLSIYTQLIPTASVGEAACSITMSAKLPAGQC